MDCSKNLFVLNVPTAEWKELGAETKFAQLSDDRIALELGDMLIEGFGVTRQEGSTHLAALFDVEDGQCAVFKLHGHLAVGIGGDEVNFPSWQVGDIGGSVVVLGGLLSDEYDGSKAQIPGFGDIPYIGSLFRNERRTRKKTNLMVFLRPVVLRDANATETFSTGRYQQMMGAQINSQVEPTPVMPIGNTIVLPPVPLAPLAPSRP